MQQDVYCIRLIDINLSSPFQAMEKLQMLFSIDLKPFKLMIHDSRRLLYKQDEGDKIIYLTFKRQIVGRYRPLAVSSYDGKNKCLRRATVLSLALLSARALPVT